MTIKVKEIYKECVKKAQEYLRSVEETITC